MRNIKINISGFELPPNYFNFFMDRLNNLKRDSTFNPTIILLINKNQDQYNGELKVYDFDFHLSSVGKSDNLMEFFIFVEEEMKLKMAAFQNKTDSPLPPTIN